MYKINGGFIMKDKLMTAVIVVAVLIAAKKILPAGLL